MPHEQKTQDDSPFDFREWEPLEAQRLRRLAWSPKSDKVFYSFRNWEQKYAAINYLDVRTGKSHRYAAFKDRLLWEIQWSPDGRTLFVMYGPAERNIVRGQIGFVSDRGES